MIGKKKQRKKRRARNGRGSLALISAMLIGSAFIRVGTEAGQAFAKGGEPEMAAKEPMSEPLACEPPKDLRRMLGAFQEREGRLVQREAELKNRLQALEVADTEIERKLAALSQAEIRLRETIALAETAAEDDLSKLTKVYESMKPKNAAALFEEMDPKFAAGFLGRMRPEAAAGVMAGLSPQAAYTISVVLAGRNAEVPTE